MSDNFIQPPANTGVGPLVDTEQLTVNAQTVQRQRIIIADPTSATGKAGVLQSGNTDAQVATSFGLQEGSYELLFNGTTWDRKRAATGTTGITAVNTEGSKATYSAASIGLVTVTGATDVFTLTGSGTKTVRVTRVSVSGTIQTAAQYVDINLVKRSTADTAGTSATPTVVPLDSTDGAGTAVATSYTANPTLGTGVGPIRAVRYFAALTGTPASLSSPVEFNFSTRNGRAVVLRGATQQLCVHLNAPANAGTFDIDIEWTEE
jgi:hypothetical protein